jgi:hypothetical protein
MSIRHFVVRIGAFVLSAVLITPGRAPCATADELPTAEQLVDLLRRQIPRFKNHHSVVMYEDRFQGKPTEWWRASLYADEFGRVLSIDEKGLRDADGTFHPRTKHNWINNGESYMMIDFTYDRRMGPLVGAGKLVYACYFAPPPGDGGTIDHLSWRSALRDMPTLSLLGSVNCRLERKEPVAIAWFGAPRDRLLQVTTEQPFPEGKKTTQTYIADLNKGGAVVAGHGTNVSGERVSEYEKEYKELPAGSKQWVPVKGVSRTLVSFTNEVPLPQGGTRREVIPPRESRFECLEYRVDDPEFTDAVFTILLPAGTYMSDWRIQKDYRLTSDTVIPAQIPETRKPLFRAWLEAKNLGP